MAAVRFEEVSADPAYQSYVGVEYVLTVPMQLSGVNAPPGYGKTVDYYVVDAPASNWSGPELVTRVTLPPGTRLRVESVLRCTTCYLDGGARIKAGIRLLDYRTPVDRPIHIPLPYLAPAFVRREGPVGEPGGSAPARAAP